MYWLLANMHFDKKQLRVVINVLTKVKQQKDNKCAHF
ncbi:unknown [Bacteroides sp. CAG:702]|nr:unknown [Bacteroides sp. CAG:702]